MVNESGNSARNDGFDKSPEEFYDKSRQEIEKYFIFALFALIAAIILLSFGLKSYFRGIDNCRSSNRIDS